MTNEPRSTYLREGLLLAAFLFIVGVAVVTVALPELSDTPHPDDREPHAANAADAGL
jgi:peptidoglycan biosynthesis protein MviN/MurJ (putative lipid II flippase)